MVKFIFMEVEPADDLVADVFAAEEDVGFEPIAGDPLGVGGEEGGFADVLSLRRVMVSRSRPMPKPPWGGMPSLKMLR